MDGGIRRIIALGTHHRLDLVRVHLVLGHQLGQRFGDALPFQLGLPLLLPVCILAQAVGLGLGRGMPGQVVLHHDRRLGGGRGQFHLAGGVVRLRGGRCIRCPGRLRCRSDPCGGCGGKGHRPVEDMGDGGIVKGQLIGQAVPVLCVPAGVVGGIHHPGTALGLALLPLVIHRHRVGLIIGEENQIRPFLDQGGEAFFLLSCQLQLPAVVGAHFVRLLELADFGVGGEHHMNAPVRHLLQQIQQAAELLGHIHIALAVAEVLDALFIRLFADMPGTELGRPVGGVKHQSAAERGVIPHIPDLVHEHGPAGRGRETIHVHAGGAALGIDEERAGEPGCHGAFADALGAVDDRLLGLFLHTARDGKCH